VGEFLPKQDTGTYPHTIFYDFESFHDKEKQREVTALLRYENAHVPISVNVGETLQS